LNADGEKDSTVEEKFTAFGEELAVVGERGLRRDGFVKSEAESKEESDDGV
jgi:hypothetical protein